MSGNREKPRTTKTSQRVKSLAEQQLLYEQVLAKSGEEKDNPQDPEKQEDLSGSGQNKTDDKTVPAGTSPQAGQSGKGDGDHVPSGSESDTSPLKTTKTVSGNKNKRHHIISSEPESSDEKEDSPSESKKAKKGDPELVKNRKILKPKGKKKKQPPSAAAGSAAQLQAAQGFGQNQTFPQANQFNQNFGQPQNMQQNQDPFAMIANIS